MAVLSEEVKLYIVQCLACFDSPSVVANSVAEEFNVTVDRMQVQKYDATKAAGKDMAKKHREIFTATREAFLAETVQIPIASRSFRLRSLQRMHDNYINKRNFVQAQAVLEQAAKEVGNVFTNKQLLGGDKENPFAAFIAQIGGSSMPVITEVVGETIENEAPQKVALWTSRDTK